MHYYLAAGMFAFGLVAGIIDFCIDKKPVTPERRRLARIAVGFASVAICFGVAAFIGGPGVVQ